MLYITLCFWKLLEFYLNMLTINDDSSVGVAVVVNKDNVMIMIMITITMIGSVADYV